jgi:hypothetical protein
VSEDHPADRPSWDCKACGQPWPCNQAREQLVAELGLGTRLTLWMSIDMVDAARENGKIPPHELYQRFVAWTNERPADSTTSDLARSVQPGDRTSYRY